jgi:AraC family L-rhamnose operon transcriptional activator RhaR
MDQPDYPLLKGSKLFREKEQVYVNLSHELPEYCELIHKHDFIEIAYVTSGRGLHIVGGHRYEVTPGDLFIINYDVPHGFFRLPENSESPVLYNCVFAPGFLDASLFRCSTYFKDITTSLLFKSLFPEENHSAAPDLCLRGLAFQTCGDLFTKMYAEYHAMSPGYCDLIRAYLIELIIKIFRLLASDPRQTTSAHHQQLVERAVAYIQQHYQSELKLTDLALHSFISKNYFSKLFKEVTGTNFSDYVQKVRIDEACRLLRATDLKIVDIALQAGFKDLKFFYDVFKKITGKTPGDYRQ